MLAELLNSVGAAIWLALGAGLVAGALILVQGGFARARVRLPAICWLFPSVGAYAVIWLASVLRARQAMGEVAVASLDQIAAHGARATADLWRTEALALGLGALLLLLTAWIVASSHVASTLGPKRTKRYRTSWVHALFPLLSAIPAGIVVVLLGAWMGATITGLLLSMSLVAGLVALSIASSQRGRRRREDARLGAARGLVAACTVGAVLAVALGSGALLRAEGLSGALTLAIEERPAHLILSLASARGVQGLGLLTAGLALLTGAFSVVIVPRALGSWRTLLGAWLSLLLLMAVPGLQLARSVLLAPLLEIPRGGALAHLPPVLRSGLSQPQDLIGPARVDHPLTGSCLVLEHASGWAGAPLYRLLDQDAAIAHLAEGPIDPLERKPGCPPNEAALREPFSTYESPVILVDKERLAPMISGHRWFLRAGTLRLLLSPTAGLFADDPPASRVWRYRTLPFDWELPPDDPPVGDGGTQWDFEGAARLPVTLLEGPRPLLVAGGSRDYIDLDRHGAEALRDALLGSEDRRLVLVPRKDWKVGDLAAFCLTVYGRVEGARCVLRPENPERWSKRTGLPLPWGQVEN